MPKTIMIVEDYADSREVTKILIQHLGYNVIEAVDGSDAVVKAQYFQPDLILMDLAMPVMDGVAATKLIRKSAGFDKVSIIALTGFGNTEFERAIEAGFDNVIIKPLGIENLKPLLNRYLI